MRTIFAGRKVFAPFLTLAVIFSLCVSGHPVRAAESYKDVRKEVATDINSKDPKTRLGAVVRLAKTADPKAADLIVDLLLKEADADVSQRMGMALKHTSSPECVEKIAKKALKLTNGKDLFPLYWILSGVAAGRSQEGDALVEQVIFNAKDKTGLPVAAALEAIAAAERPELSGLVEKVLNYHDKKWETDLAIIPVTACSVAGRIADGSNKLALVSALNQALGKYENVKIKYFAAAACGRISGEKAYMDTAFWERWVKAEGKITTTDSENAERTAVRLKAPKFFGAEAVGKRIVFVIDVSGSMQHPIDVSGLMKAEEEDEKKKEKKEGSKTGRGKKDKEKEKEEGPPPPDYSKVKIKLDLAVVELIYSLQQLTDDYYFNIVTYDTGHRFLMSGMQSFVQATEANKLRYIKAVEKLAPLQLTNIHGALIRGFKCTDAGLAKDDPAWDGTAMTKGADTIFFLTDGFPCWDDGSTGPTPQGFGNGKFAVDRGAIANDILRVNTFRKVVIHTVGIGQHDGELLNYLAENSGGYYKDLTGAAGQ